jgi:hypothetical protein
MGEVNEAGQSKVSSPPQESEATTASKGDNIDYQLGGRSKERCYCLLDGFFEDPESGRKSRITIPIARLPATIGRAHDKDADDPHFFGLGSKKALSRKHCRISYRDAPGGMVEWDTSKQELSYKEPSGDGKEGLATLNVEDSKLPSKGFFVIECLGKNRILVNQGRVEQGNAAVLASGSSLRISSYTLYFLRPTDSNPVEHVVISAPTSSKKRKVPDASPSSSTAGKKGSKAQQDELDSLSVENLLEKMTEAIDTNQWERKNQLIGATIALHAVRESALDPNIQSMALDSGVSRSDVMVWIEESPKYANWVQQMLTKMEPRSYQAAITKCLLKAGFTRTGSSGRYIKWYLPKDTPISPQVMKKENKKGTQSKSKDEKGKLEEREDQDEGGEEEDNDDEEQSKAETGQEDQEDGEEKSEGDGDDADEEIVEDEGDDVANDEDDEGEEEEDRSDSGSELKKHAPPAADMDAADDSSDDEI